MAQGKYKNPDLTPRELGVVAALSERGGRNVELAKHLGISVDTVKTHLRHSYQKWGLHTRAALVAEYNRRLTAGTLPVYETKAPDPEPEVEQLEVEPETFAVPGSPAEVERAQ